MHEIIAAKRPEVEDLCRRIVAFRNILIHGYGSVDDALVRQTLIDKVPALDQVLRRLLDRADG